MKWFLAFLLGLGMVSNSWGTHIVGGEFELIHLNDYNYRLNLIQYFDVVNGNPAAEDSVVVVFMFRKSDNQFMRSVSLPKTERELVSYTQPECAIGSLITRRLVYSHDIFLDPVIFNDPEGYYVVFERCCRNNVISNILLVAPNTVGQTFYMEFPPVIKNGQPFVNSSPSDFPPVGDFACDDELFFFDFAGVDQDGDSLVYSMSNPLNSSSIVALPTPSPAPHPVVLWNTGFNINNQITGTPPLNITPNGFLTVNPDLTGLFSFAVKVEEFRDDQKIGETRRDFQMLVIDCPGPNFPPQIQVRKKNGDIHDPEDLLAFAFSEEKCFDILITDLNSQSQNEFIELEVLPIDFNADLGNILSDSSGVLTLNNDTLSIEVCLPDCPYVDGPFKLEFRASDQTCPFALADTVLLTISIEPPPNQDPFFTNFPKIVTDTLVEGETFNFTAFGSDLDADSLEITILGDGFDISFYQMNLVPVVNLPGMIESDFVWDTSCGINQFQLFNDFPILLILNDLDECNLGNPDTLRINLHVILPPNNDPIISTNIPGGSNPDIIIERSLDLFTEVTFEVFAADIDPDTVMLTISGDGFSPGDLGMVFPSAQGLSATESTFFWSLDCDKFNLDQKDEFLVFFIATDADTCKIPNADTLKINFKIIPPPNSFPELTILELDTFQLNVQAGNTIDLNFLGTDPDQDSLFLELVSFSQQLSPGRFQFTPVEGISPIQGRFIWNTECSDLNNLDSTEIFEFTFVLTDNYCVRVQSDVIVLLVNLFNEESAEVDFLPPNVFTPNGDGVNDTFFIRNLPPDNCGGKLEQIVIFNRWGKEVFRDDKRDFIWDGQGMSAGVYYYYISYSNNTDYNGIISIML